MRPAGVSMLALMLGAAAWGQQSGGIQEIVVTAQQRTQSAQDVPMSLQVLGAEQIENVAANDIHDLQTYVPGLTVTGSQTEPHFSLRGIRSNDFGVGTDPAVGIYIDGVYSSRSGASITNFDDVAQIEILKGPQGTLLGRNSPAGAISITTNKPSDKYEGEISTRFGNLDERRVQGMLNIPLTDSLDLRVSGVGHANDGFIKDAVSHAHLDKNEEFSGKLALRWRPDNLTDALLTYRRDDLNGSPSPTVNISPLVPSAPISFIYPALRPVFPFNPATLTDPVNTPYSTDLMHGKQTRQLDDVTLNVTRDLGFAKLTSISNYRYFHTGDRESEDGTNVPYLYLDTNAKEKNSQIYQEVKLNHADETFDWVSGASYYREHANQVRDVNGNTSTLDVAAFNTEGVAPFYTIDKLLTGAGLGRPFTGFEGQSWSETMINNGGLNQAYAVFGDVIWHAMDRLDLTAGVRFTRDEKSYTWDIPTRTAPTIDATIASLGGTAGLTQILSKVLQATGIPAPYANGQAAALVAATQNNFALGTQAAYGRHFALDDSWNNLSPRAVVDYAFTDHMHGYVSFSEGYKAGGFNSQQPPTPNTALASADAFGPEKMYNYEMGLKTSFPKIGVLFNASLYHYDYLNKQNVEFVQPCSSCVDEFVTQTEDDQANGIDFNAIWQPTDQLQFALNGNLIDATVKKPGPTLPGEVPIIGGKPTGEPWLSFTVAASYTLPLANGDDLRFDATHAYRGHGRCNSNIPSTTVVNSCNEPLPFDSNKAENTTDLRVSYIAGRGNYKISAFVNNLFDNRWVTYLGGDGVDTLGTPAAEISAPRTGGVDLTMRF